MVAGVTNSRGPGRAASDPGIVTPLNEKRNRGRLRIPQTPFVILSRLLSAPCVGNVPVFSGIGVIRGIWVKFRLNCADPQNLNHSINHYDASDLNSGMLRAVTGELTVQAKYQARRALLALLVAGASATTITGCSGNGMSLASMNPFGGAASTPSVSTGVSESIADTGKQSPNRFASFGTSAKNAMAKTTSFFTGGTEPGEDEVVSHEDPLRLDRKPETLDPDIFVANGQLWESTGNMNKAMESYARALQHQADYVPALSSIARLHFRQGNHEHARKYFDSAISLSPEDAVLHHDLGLTYSKLGNHAQAIASLNKALEMSPQNSRFANNLASVYFESGNRLSASQVLAKNNPPAVAHFNMAYLCYKHGHLDDARGHLNEAVKYEPLAATDAGIKRAVERSRQMLEQLDGPASVTAQSEPQAKVAVRPETAQLPQRVMPAAGTQPQSTPAGVLPTMTPNAAYLPQKSVDSRRAVAVPTTSAVLPASAQGTPATPGVTAPAATNALPASVRTPSPGGGQSYLAPTGFRLPQTH